MSQDEFFAFMPLLIYGIAVSELVMHWRDYLKKDRRYWPHLITGLILLELAFLNFYYLYDKLDELFSTYYYFLFRLLSPIVLLLAVSVYTPEEDRGIKEYFKKNASIVFTLIGVFILLNIVTEFGFNYVNLIRAIGMMICFLIALTNRFWLLWLWIILRAAIVIIEFEYPFLL